MNRSATQSANLNGFLEHLAVAPLADFVEQVGGFFERFTQRKDLGRTWATLYVSPYPLTQAELSTSLNLSADLVDSCLIDLHNFSAIRTLPKTDTTATRYAPDTLRAWLSALVSRELRAATDLRKVVAEVRLAYGPLWARQYRDGAPHQELMARLQTVTDFCALYGVLTDAVGRVTSLPLNLREQTEHALKLVRLLNRSIPKRS